MALGKAANLYHHGDLRPALMRACLDVLRESSFGALSLREVARRAGVSHAAPYRHFADKEALLAAVAEEGFRLLAERIEAAARGGRDPLSALRAAMVAYLRFGQSQPEHLQLMFGRDIAADQPMLKAVAQEAFAALVALVRAVWPRASEAQSRTLALGLWGQVHGLLLLATPLQLQDLAPGADSLAAAQRAIDATLERLAAGQAW
jgi:AcrR family transcriptional regulator